MRHKIRTGAVISYHRVSLRQLLAMLAAICCLCACTGKGKTISDIVFRERKNRAIDRYPKIPKDEIIQQASSSRLYSELREYYKKSLLELKVSTDRDCAKLIVVVLTIETGKYATPASTFGIPFIFVTTDNMGVDYYDLAKKIAENDVTELTQTTEDGVWSKKGAIFIADQLDSIISKYNDQHSSKKFPDTKKPATFGDLQPNQDEMMYDYGDAPYHLKVNSQGLRMDHDLKFPKKKQTILILGDAEVFSPLLDNEYIATSILQRRHPDKEIINAGVNNYTMDDYTSLYEEKARFTEPDIVIVCTNGGDILEQFFTQRNKYSRSNKIYEPSEAELLFYNELYGKK